jgi:hypothetical protein
LVMVWRMHTNHSPALPVTEVDDGAAVAELDGFEPASGRAGRGRVSRRG